MPTYIRLTDYKSSEEKEKGFFKPENRYEAKQEDFEKIPGSPIAYWVSDRVKEIFAYEKKLEDITKPKFGMRTGDNDRFLRYWNEINKTKLNTHKWFSFSKGGSFRRWYGNNNIVVNWENDGWEIKEATRQAYPELGDNLSWKITNEKYYFKRGITWSRISSKNISFRLHEDFAIFSDEAPAIIDDESQYFLSLLNSKVIFNFLNILNPTLRFQVENISKLPIIFPKSPEIKQKIDQLTQECIDISKEEWDSRETSWDFRINELIRMKNEELRVKSYRIEDAYDAYCKYWREKFFILHRNEEELNRLFIDIYELQDELTPEVPLEDITILKNEAKIEDGELVFQADEIMKQFISYGVGVMFGRYSLDSEGLLIANMGQEVPTDTTFEIDDDNIIPVLEEDYFTDDIASRFVQFVKAAFGEEHLSENLRFIEASLGTTLRKYFVKGFYEDHIKRYKKRPIYWMVASPKKGFMSLIYMHRYEPDTFARVRNSYLTEYIAKLEAHQETLQLTVTSETASNKGKKDADKQIKNIEKKLKELIEFDRERMMHFAQNPTEIDLDDGVKVNYCKFKEILYPIMGLCKKLFNSSKREQ